MAADPTRGLRAAFIWVAVAATLAVPIGIAATSPLLAWRDPVYIAAGFAGVVAMALFLLQPLLVAGYLPGFPARRGRRIHRWIGGSLVAAIVLHVVGLWITSPPDVVDALLFRSPTPFSAWGVVAMWALFGTALLALFRHTLRLRWRSWRIAHTSFVVVIIAGSVIHAVLIEGAMGTVSKIALCGLVIAAMIEVFVDLKVWARGAKAQALKSPVERS